MLFKYIGFFVIPDGYNSVFILFMLNIGYTNLLHIASPKLFVSGIWRQVFAQLYIEQGKFHEPEL
jgi:hypothetical protein